MSAVKYITRSNGDKHPVRYDVNAYCHFEDVSGGKSLLRGMAELDVRFMRALVYVGLACGAEYEKKEFKLTLQDVGRWDDLLSNVFTDCSAILKEMSGKEKEGEGKEPGER